MGRPDLRDALASLVSSVIDRTGGDPAAVRALAAALVPKPAARVPAAPLPPARPASGPAAGDSAGADPVGAGLPGADPAGVGPGGAGSDGARPAEAGSAEVREIWAVDPDVALSGLLAAADSLAGPARADALVRAGEAICFLGDHFRYAEVVRRAAGGRAEGVSPALLAQIDGFGALFEGRYPDAVVALRRVVTFAEGVDGGRVGVTELLRGSAAALVCGDDDAALRFAARAEAIATAGGDIAAVPRALELKGTAELWRGAHDAAVSTALAGARAATDAGRPADADNHLAMLALLAALRGDRAACRWRLAQAGTVHVRPARPGAAWPGAAGLGAAGPGAAGLGAAGLGGERSGAGWTGAGHGRPRALARWALGVLDLLAGRPHEAAARLGGIADPRTGRGHVLVAVMAAPDLVEAAVLAGDPGAARAALTAFDRWAASTGEPLRRALAARCHALLARRGSAEAEAHFREALRLHLAGESEFQRARTQLLFGRDLRRRRRPGQAREQIGAALDAFVRCGARPWAEQARAELRVCGGAARPAGATVPLTAQQLQIARLVAAGATNREVAARLFLSTRTVDHHMRNIFHRLGISSRVALAKMIT
ncbi:hypothetical protein JCM9533A_26220 [Catenuloplanes niger JCM 9533]